MSADLLTLTQWLSPAFPVGSYAYSQGLEAAIAEGALRDAAGLEAWVAAVLQQGAGRMDAILLRTARQEGADLVALADLALALAPSAERWAEMRDQGAAFGATVAATGGPADLGLPLAVAMGRASRSLDLSDAVVLALWMQAQAAQLVSAAVRFVPLGQTEGQAVMARLGPRIADWAAEFAALTLDDLGSAGFGADLAAMRQGMLEVRIFRS